MKKLTHINFGITTMLGSACFLNIFSPIFTLLPFLAILSDADHGQDSLSRKGLSLPGKHRGWSHSIFGTVILSFIVSIVLYGILYLSYKYGLHKEISITELYSLLFQNYTYIIGLIVVILVFFSILNKILGRILKPFIGIGTIIIFLGGLVFLYLKHYIGLNIFLINLFIFSHLIGDFFTVSGIPLLYPLVKDKFRFLFYVSTNTKGEKIANFLITLVNLGLIYLLYKNNYISILQQYHPIITDIIFLIFSFLVIIYFLNKQLNIKKNILQKGGNLVKTTVWHILKTLFTITLSGAFIILARLVYTGSIPITLDADNIELIVSGLLMVLGLFGIIISFTNLFKTLDGLLDISELFVYSIMFLLEFVMFFWVLYLYIMGTYS